MQVLHDLTIPITQSPTVLTTGKFDGVHIGLQQLIHLVVVSARAVGEALATQESIR